MALPQKEVWPLTSWAHQTAKLAMDHRADREKREVLEYQKDLKDVHGQAVRDYEIFQQLIQGGFRFLNLIGHPTGSIAIDMGSGTGVGATILSKFPFIEKVYAVELSEGFVDYIMPLTFEKFGAQTHKIVRVVGDFNNLRLPNESVDIILDIDSFHHSENLKVTLQECYRVLKNRGVIIAVDRGWPDSYAREQLESMLDVELNERLKQKYGIPPNQRFTRRDFGEHEYTIQEWEIMFQEAGFTAHIFSQRHPPALNRIWLRLPTFETTIWVSSLFAKVGRQRHIIYGWGKTRILMVAMKTSL